MSEHYKTHHTIDESQELIKKYTKSFINLSTDNKCIVAKVKQDQFSMFYFESRKSGYNVICKGQFYEESQVTMLKLTFTSMLLSKAFMIFNFVMIAVLSLIFQLDPLDSLLGYLLITIIFIFLGIASINTKKNQYKKNLMRSYLKKLLKLEEVEKK